MGEECLNIIKMGEMLKSSNIKCPYQQVKNIPFIGYMIYLLFYIGLKGRDRKITKMQSIIVDIKYMKEKWDVQAILALETQIQQIFVEITTCQTLYSEI